MVGIGSPIPDLLEDHATSLVERSAPGAAAGTCDYRWVLPIAAGQRDLVPARWGPGPESGQCRTAVLPAPRRVGSTTVRVRGPEPDAKTAGATAGSGVEVVPVPGTAALVGDEDDADELSAGWLAGAWDAPPQAVSSAITEPDMIAMSLL